MAFFKNLFKKGDDDIKKTDDNTVSMSEMRNDNNSSIQDIIVSAWQNLDAGIIEPFLSNDLEYNSAWAYDTITSKEDYIHHLRYEFEEIKETGESQVVDFIEENGRMFPHVVIQNPDIEFVIDFTELDGKIVRMLKRPVLKISVVDMGQNHDFAEEYSQKLRDLYRFAGETIQDYIDGKGVQFPEFTWLQTSLLKPSFQHFCFRYKSDIYSILVALHGWNLLKIKNELDYNYDPNRYDKIVVPQQDYENLIAESDRNNLIPCILPIASIPQVPLISESHLIHAVSGEFITFENKRFKECVPMSKWEINSMGIQFVINHLTENNMIIKNYCDVVGIAPQIWFEDNGKMSYVFVRTTAMGNRQEKYDINKNMLLRLSDYNGYFADLQFVSSSPILKDEKGNIVPLSKRDGDEDIWLWRGDQFYCNFRGLQKIEQAIVDNTFINVIDSECYDIP